MSSFTLTLSGDSSELSANYHPPIELDPDGEYVCGLVDLQTYMSIPNVNERNNKFRIAAPFKCSITPKLVAEYKLEVVKNPEGDSSSKIIKWGDMLFEAVLAEAEKKKIELTSKENLIKVVQAPANENGIHNLSVKYIKVATIPTGSYEFDELAIYLQRTLESGITLQCNKTTLKCELKASEDIYFSSKMGTIGSLLGFKDGILKANKVHISDSVIKINSTNVIKVETNITTGAYSNNTLAHTLHEFYPTVGIGYKIVEVPKHVIYLPVATRSIHNFVVRLVDQDNALVDFRGETITLRVHIKRI